MNSVCNKFDVLIIGGGYVGLSVAGALNKNGFKCAILEKSHYKNTRAINDPGRLLAISTNSVEILKKFDLVTNLSEIGQAISFIAAFEDNESNILRFDPESISKENFGYMVEEDLLFNELHKSLRKDVEIFDEFELIEFSEDLNQVTLKLKNQVISAKIAIIADGKKSKFRAMCGIEFYKHDYKQQALVCEVEHTKHHNGVAVEIFMPGGPFAILPKKGGYKSCIVWSIENDIAKALKTLSAENVEELIHKNFNNCFGEMSVTSTIKFFSLDLIVSKEYFSGRKVLLGDSLHAIHPIAGQGYNLSLRDLDCLCELLIKNRNLGLDYGSQLVFEKYRKQRELDNNIMIEATHHLNGLFSNSFIPLKILRKKGLRIVNSFTKLKTKFIKYACGLRL